MHKMMILLRVFFIALFLMGTAIVRADVSLERFVKTDGSAANGGTSWDDALDNIQDAINNLRSAMQSQGVQTGAIYVAEGTYNPTESIEAQNSNILNTSFLIYEGITIYGGYPADIADGDDYSPENRAMESDGPDVDGNAVYSPWHFRYKTILSGNHSGLDIEFNYNAVRGMYDTRFPSNSYHVVWFGTKGEIDHPTIKGHRQGYTVPAGVDGCTIEGGFASSKELKTHDHMAYGGGAYMVENTFLRNCIVQKCQAAQRGGGVYLDGGGSVSHCFVQQCQATGVAIAQGYGGGICIDYNGSVVGSYLTQNASRIGGGLAICHTPNEYPFTAISPYQPYATTCIISNNTSNAEGGGVYLDEGGTLNHCTVVKNRCTGPDITYYGRRHGRSGGVYVRNCGMIYNSVFWDNRCAANSDIQFASIQQTGAATTGIDVFHSAFYQMDITDWSGVNKYDVYSLTNWNRPHRAKAEHCTWFEMNPTILNPPGKPANSGSLLNDLFAGIDYDTETLVPKAAQLLTTWRPQHNSYLARKGIQVSQSIHLNSEWIRHAHSDADIIGASYDKVSSLGALANKEETYDYALVLPQGEEGRTGAAKDTPIPTMFVDFQRDNYQLSQDHVYENFGRSWYQPVMQLSDAVNFFERYRIKEGADVDKYRLPDHVGEGDPQTYTVYPAVQILIKEGTTTTAGHGNYAENGDLRTAAIRPKSNMRFYGGYSDVLTLTDISVRNPVEYQTMVSSNNVNDYNNASAHAFALINVHDVIIDGLRLAYGNASNVEIDAIVKKGAGVIVSNTTIPQADRIDMTGNIVRNCVIANTLAHDGAAVFVNAVVPKTNGSIVRAQLDLQNTIVRNCTALQDEDMMVAGEYPGIIVAAGNALVNIDHCTIANNEGYPLKTILDAGQQGQIVINNSALFANSRDVVEDRQHITAFAATLGDNISGSYNMIDKDAPTNATLVADATNHYILDVNSSSTNYPTFKNPSFNVGHSAGVDRPLYGGTVSYEPLNKNPLVNAADDASMGKYDRTDVNHFDFGGAADVGAVESVNLPKKGTVLYVTQNGAGKMDGSSWANAINGNAVYRVGETFIKDAVADTIVTTRDPRYKGGYAIDYVFLTGTTTYTDNQTVTKRRVNITVESDGSETVTDGGSTVLEDQDISYDVVMTNGLTKMKNASYPYGEKSGSSRGFWRTNLRNLVKGTNYYTKGDYGNSNINTSTNLTIANDRYEDYVSGLQFAVEQAARLNKDKAKEDYVQVWVGHGTYEDYKGFVMRDKVTVLGGFPTDLIPAPGESERHALVAFEVPLSRLNASLDGKQAQYETILQVQGSRPYQADFTFNTSVRNYEDKDWTASGNTSITTEAAVTIPVYYRREAGGEYQEVKGDNVVADLTSLIQNPSFEIGVGNMGDLQKDGSNTTEATWSATNAKYGWTISNGSYSLAAGSSKYNHGAQIQNNTNFVFYQDLETLEEGFYRISCQGFNADNAQGNVKLFANGTERPLASRKSGDSGITTLQKAVDKMADGGYDENWVDVYVGKSGRLRFGLKGVYAGSGWTVFDNFRLERIADCTVSESTMTGSRQTPSLLATHTTIRKPVLFMPDVCLPTYWPCTVSNDNLSNKNRASKRVNGNLTGDPGSGYKAYTDVCWDGFTIKNGFYYDNFANRDGGAGVRMFEGAKLANCVIMNNATMAAQRGRGGGGYCDGKTSEVVGCFFINNVNSSKGGTSRNNNGGGIYLLVGTCFNTLLANNICQGTDARGAGIYIESATFFNNTVCYNNLYNTSGTIYTNSSNGSGVHQYTGNMGARLDVFNTVFYKNSGKVIGCVNVDNLNVFKNCYIQSDVEIPTTIQDKFSDSRYGMSLPNPFEEGESASAENNYRLLGTSYCVNKGRLPETEEERAVFPTKDVDFSNRIQDCGIDIGAYEYDGAVDIKPDTITFADKKLAVYYVTQNGVETGDASASSPDNAACASKLQKVLDAAGRYKYDLYEHPENHVGKADYTVMVALAGNPKGNTFAYSPERSAIDGNDDVLGYSLIIPHGVQLWGGFHSDFYEDDGEGGVTMLRDILRYPTYISGDVVSLTGATGNVHHVIHFTDNLYDIYERKMDGQLVAGKLSALTQEKDRAVLDGLFVKNGHANGAPAGDGSVTTDMNGAAAIVPGFAHIRNCVITDNQAAGYGGGLYLKPKALVSGTIIKNNTGKRGGGIYVEQPAGDVVSSSTFSYILTSTVVNNEASEVGGGLYFESNLRANSSVFWHNSALDRNNVSGWQVQKSGSTSSISSVNYPMAYCGIEVARWEGVNNLLVSASETEGVRWDHKDYYERYYDADAKESIYFPIEMSSVLSRSGMTYDSYRKYCHDFPTLATLDTTDIAGYQILRNAADVEVAYDSDAPYSYIRKAKNNALIEMGARVVNANFEVTFDAKHIMKRLYVVHTEDLDSKKARELQDNLYLTSGTDEQKETAKMYSQMGSCFANPFHRLGDALQYIINVRKDPTLGSTYKDQRFEIFVTNGTFYPYRNAYGMEAASRSNTFVIPEEVTLVGGVDNLQHYGQPGYGLQNTYAKDNVAVGVKLKSYDGLRDSTYNLNLSTISTDSIRRLREQSDLNMNNVVEPWELNKQTILSGSVVSGTESKNAYHVITCYSDADKLGKLPTMYSDVACEISTDDRKQESRESIAKRTIFLDGITVSNGLANDISEEDEQAAFQRVTYFRGGGIFIDGNWDHVSENASYIPEVIGVAERNIPLVVTSCQFQENMAGNGGAIYTNGSLLVTGSHFAQNSSRGPDTPRDQKYIPWTAGGAIATNYDCTVVNTIFANNEAKRGALPITISGAAGVDRADIRQGFGGVISSSETSTVHALNCNFVRNKAVAFPAIYNFLCQSEKSEQVAGEYVWERGDRKHWAVNCIFWGNEANEDVSAGGQVNSYAGNASNDPETRTLGSLFTVADPSKTVRKRADVANFGISDRSEEVLFFCAYEKDYGLDSKLIVEDDAHKDAHKKTVVSTWDYYEKGTFVDEYPEEWYDGPVGKRVVHTNNQLLDSNNDALGGPNFIQPSTTAGIEGYMQNADWLVSRLNRLIDTGWSYLPQEVTAHMENHNGENVDVFSTEFEHYDDGDRMDNPSLKGSGIYNFFSLKCDELYGGMGMADLTPIGEHAHMKYDQFGLKTGMNSTMRRISTYPKQGEQEVFIDIGVYEYQYVQLFIPGNAYDVIWVRPDNPSDGTVADGTTWSRATNNVQQAIDMLMSSHNNHDKVLKVRAGDYSPVYLTHGQLAYYIEHDENPNSILYPSAVAAGQELHVGSITIRGGYPNEEVYMIPDKTGDYDGENVRDPEQYPTRFIMSGATGYEDRPEVKENLFVVRNMELQTTVTNFIAEKEINKQGYVVPVAFEGITFSNPYAQHPGGESENLAGAAILYMQQDKKSGGLCEAPATKGDVWEVDGRPKLLIKDCVFLDNSNPDKNGGLPVAPAVHIMNGGGDAVVANSLFHSNGGEPLVGVNTKVVNCAFALNAGQLTLTNDVVNGTGSVMHNSLIWKDAEGKTLPYNFQVSGILGKNNAIYGDDALSDIPDANGNVTLSATNNDILHGPNFINPSATDPWQRDMHPRPTDILMSKADTALYHHIVPFYQDESTYIVRSMEVNGAQRSSTIQTVTRSLQPYKMVTVDDWKTAELDLAQTQRFRGKGLERGPYEVQAAVQRVYYVNPSLMPSPNSDGATWERAFSQGRLQDAIDAAGVYSATNGGQRAFIFVKGDGYSLNAPVLARDGVSIYGGVTNTIDCAVAKPIVIDGDHTFKEVEIFNYINRVRAARNGVATTDVASLLEGVTAEDDMTSGFLLDGFHFVNPEVTLDDTPIKLKAPKTVLRNSVIYNNKVAGDKPVVDITQGLLYNSLLYGNDATTHVRVGSSATGGVLNCTVVADKAGQTAVASSTADKVVNTITANVSSNPDGDPSGTGTFAYCNTKSGMFAPYLHEGRNVYDYPFGDRQPLWYQLHELSECINGGTNSWTSYFGNSGNDFTTLWEGLTGDDTDGWVSGYSTKTAQKFIDFTQDRDIIGNPRLLFSTVDRGAFETWSVPTSTAVEVTNETETTDADSDGRPDCPVTHYGGHLYPHVGSVTYVGENGSLCLKADNFNSAEKALDPGFLLLKKGASLYGQGNHLRLPYVAVERDFNATTNPWVLFSLPFNWQQANISSVAAAAGGTDGITQTLKNESITGIHYYDGAKRAEWDYLFQIANSPCWMAVAEDDQQANNGYLLSMTGGSQTLRFNSWGVDEYGLATAIYSEDGSDKTVVLTQYDNIPRDGKAHFTTNENMGWNLKGMPWLVNSYKTYAIDGSGNYDSSSEDYQMNVPHLFYKMNGDGTYIKAGNLYTQQSWANGSTMTLGDAYFTQTAILGDEETLVFAHPVYTGSPVLPAPRHHVAISAMVSGELYDDVATLYPQADGDATLDYHEGSDGMKWMPFDEGLAQLYVVGRLGVRMSLVASAPVETDIPLGVAVPQAGDYVVSLPDRDAYSDYTAVWLTDHETKTVTNLLQDSYTLPMTTGGVSENRLTLRFGGRKPVADKGMEQHLQGIVKVRAFRGRLPLISGDAAQELEVYTVGGNCVFSGTAGECRRTVFADGVYIMKWK